MFGNMFLLLTFQITVVFNIGIPFKETVVMWQILYQFMQKDSNRIIDSF